MRTGVLRLVIPLLLAAGLADCTPDTGSACIIGPCDTSGGTTRLPAVVGFPSARVSGGVGHLSPGDTVTLRAVRISRADMPCMAADTIRTGVLWGVTNPSVATITPLPDGSARLRAVAAGSVQVVMREGGSDPLSTLFDVKNIFHCPDGLIFSISSIAVAP